VDLRARPHALHNFLAKVTALGKVDGVQLAGFLRQIALGNILAVARLGMLQAHDAKRVFVGGFDAGRFDLRDQRVALLAGRNDKEPRRSRVVEPGNELRAPFLGAIFGRRLRSSDTRQSVTRAWPLDGNGGSGGGEIFEDDVVHDDELVEMLIQLPGYFRLGIEQKMIRPAEDGNIA